MQASRTRTRAGQWARVWEAMEDAGLPTYSAEAQDWDRRYESTRAYELLEVLDQLQERKLTKDEVGLVGDALLLAFKMGRDHDGRIG